MLRPTVIQVLPEKNGMLLLTFDNGEKKRFDVKPHIEGNFYGKLADKDYFNCAATDGFTVCWPDGQDLCPDELYYSSVKV